MYPMSSPSLMEAAAKMDLAGRYCLERVITRAAETYDPDMVGSIRLRPSIAGLPTHRPQPGTGPPQEYAESDNREPEAPSSPQPPVRARRSPSDGCPRRINWPS